MAPELPSRLGLQEFGLDNLVETQLQSLAIQALGKQEFRVTTCLKIDWPQDLQVQLSVCLTPG